MSFYGKEPDTRPDPTERLSRFQVNAFGGTEVVEANYIGHQPSGITTFWRERPDHPKGDLIVLAIRADWYRELDNDDEGDKP